MALFVLLGGTGIAGCSGGTGSSDSSDPSVDVQLSTAPTPPIVGPTRIVVELAGPDGPITDATVRIEASPVASEAGAALEADAAHSAEGHYVEPSLDFPTGGEWSIDVHIRLADGTRLTHSEELRVSSGGPPR